MQSWRASLNNLLRQKNIIFVSYIHLTYHSFVNKIITWYDVKNFVNLIMCGSCVSIYNAVDINHIIWYYMVLYLNYNNLSK